ncbi:macrophage mannose receptor 1-like [Tachypleus tridentatus]|uniref:macrophage mannose receptor 1-like n=1 Tax=Tachypleus tridentatus TaxID=6853 RepID=UPI003FD2EE0A
MGKRQHIYCLLLGVFIYLSSFVRDAIQVCYPRQYDLLGTCFQFIKRPLPFTRALKLCEEHEWRLAKIRNQDMVDMLNTSISRLTDELNFPFWVGITDNDKERLFQYIDGEPFTFDISMWAPGEPDNGAKNFSNCAFMNLWGKLHDFQCSRNRKGICETRIHSNLSNCSESNMFGDKCFFLVDVKTDFWSSNEVCNTYGGHLAKVINKTIGDHLHRMILTDLNYTLGYWVGMTDEEREAVWKFIDGEDAPFIPELWMKSEPGGGIGFNEDCVASDPTRGFKLIDMSCRSEQYLICEGKHFDTECPPGYELHTGTCYKLFHFTKTFHHALVFCEEEGGTLAKVTNLSSWEFFMSKLINYTQDVWVGITDLQDEGVWRDVDGDLAYLHKSPGFSYPVEELWARDQPNEHSGKESCGSLSPSLGLKLASRNCTNVYKFICEVATQSECYIDYVNFNNTCYKLVQITTDFHSARMLCEKENGILAKMNLFTWEFLTSLIKMEMQDVWIGLVDEKNEGVWKYDDGSLAYVQRKNSTSYLLDELWAKGQPSNFTQSCGSITPSLGFKLSGRSCTHTYKFFCEVVAHRGKQHKVFFVLTY